MIWSTDSDAHAEKQHLNETLLPETGRSIIVTNEHEVIVGVSSCWVQMCGFEPHEAFGNTPRMLQGEKTDRAAAKMFTAQMRKGERARTVLVNYKKSRKMFRHEIAGWQHGDLLVVITLSEQNIQNNKVTN